MKKIIFIIFTLSVLFICACGSGTEEASSQEDRASKEADASKQTKPDVTAVVTRDFVDEKYSRIDMLLLISRSSIPEIIKTGKLEDYVSDHERNIDENFYYRMFKVEGGGYFYVFIRKLEPNESLNPKLNDAVSHFAFVEKPMKMSDFSDLSVGDTLDEVESIDPGARYVKDYAINSLHLCSDGLVVISYDEPVEGQDRKILSIYFSDDYTFLRDENADDYSEESDVIDTIVCCYYSCAIASEDYPK